MMVRRCAASVVTKEAAMEEKEELEGLEESSFPFPRVIFPFKWISDREKRATESVVDGESGPMCPLWGH